MMHFWKYGTISEIRFPSTPSTVCRPQKKWTYDAGLTRKFVLALNHNSRRQASQSNLRDYPSSSESRDNENRDMFDALQISTDSRASLCSSIRLISSLSDGLLGLAS